MSVWFLVIGIAYSSQSSLSTPYASFEACQSAAANAYSQRGGSRYDVTWLCVEAPKRADAKGSAE